MDLLIAYRPTDAPSSSSSSSPPQSPPPVTSLVTGTIEKIPFNSSTFDNLERRHARAAAVLQNKSHHQKQIQPEIHPKKRPRSPSAFKVSASSSKRSHNPTQSADEARSLRSGEEDALNVSEPKSNGVERTEVRAGADAQKSGKEAGRSEGGIFVPTSNLHVRQVLDYQGRSWASAPPGARTFADLEAYTPYVPKQCLTTLQNAHEGGVSVVKFSPGNGHLFLSAGMDGYARVWTTENGNCARDYLGHEKTVKDVCFESDGSRFLTAGFDKSVKLWDLEYGKVLGNYVTGGLPACVRFFPRGEGNEFLVGCSDRKVLQVDVRDARSVVQEYDQHMGGVNAIAFVEDDRRFVSSADDKVLRVWEYGIPVVIKYISDPMMHSMPVTVLHPNRKWLACQSMDNQVLVYSARQRFKHNTRKMFKGHLVAGYACGLTFSPDGRFLASGDSMGRLFFWDWRTSRILRTVHAHKGVCIGIDWHPTKSSTVVSAGWDGTIKLWD